MVDPPQLPLELLAVGPHGEVDVHHVLHHRLPEVLRDELVLSEREKGRGVEIVKRRGLD